MPWLPMLLAVRSNKQNRVLPDRHTQSMPSFNNNRIVVPSSTPLFLSFVSQTNSYCIRNFAYG